MEGFKKGLLGTLKLAATGSVYTWFVPELYKFKEYYSKVNIIFEIAITPRVVDMVVNKKVHFGIIRHSNPNYKHPLLVAKEIKYDEGILVISPNHKFAQMEEIYLEDLINENLIVYGIESNFWDQIRELFYNHGLTPKVSMDIHDFNVIKLLVQSDLGISFLPFDCVKDEINRGILKTVVLKNCPPLKRYSILIYRKDMILTELHQNFLKTINRLSNELRSSTRK